MAWPACEPPVCKTTVARLNRIEFPHRFYPSRQNLPATLGKTCRINLFFTAFSLSLTETRPGDSGRRSVLDRSRTEWCCCGWFHPDIATIGADAARRHRRRAADPRRLFHLSDDA